MDFFRVEGGEVHEVAVGPGARRHHRAGPFPLSVRRRGSACTWKSRWATSIAASSGRSSAGRTSGRSARSRRVAGDTTVGHATAYCQLVEALAGGRGVRCARNGCAASRSSSSGWRTTPATSARWPTTWRSCRPRRVREDPRRLPEPHGADLRQPLRARTRAPGRRRIRPGPERARAQLLERLDAAARGRPNSGGAALGHRLRAGALRDDGRGLRRQTPRRWAGRGRRRARAGSMRDVRHDHPAGGTVGAHPGRGLAGRGRVRARLRALAGDPALGRVRPRTARELPPGPTRVRRSASSPPIGSACRSSRAGAARSATSAITDAAGRFRRVQDRRPVVPQLAGLALALRGQADLGFPALQQELQPLLLRLRSLMPTETMSVSIPSFIACNTAAKRWPIPAAAAAAAGPSRRRAAGRRARNAPTAARRARRVCPTGPSARGREAGRARPRSLHFLRRVRRGVPDGRDHATGGLPAGRALARRPRAWRAGQEELRLADALDDKLRNSSAGRCGCGRSAPAAAMPARRT